MLETFIVYTAFIHIVRKINLKKKHENVCKNHDYSHIEMPKENNKMLEYKI